MGRAQPNVHRCCSGVHLLTAPQVRALALVSPRTAPPPFEALHASCRCPVKLTPKQITDVSGVKESTIMLCFK